MPHYKKFSKPKILLLYKQSTYASLFLNPSGHEKRWRGFFAPAEIKRLQESHKNHFEALSYVESILKNKGLRFIKVHRGTSMDYQRFDLVMTFGGDGTFLEAARQIKKGLIWGINSDPVWSVGRFCSGDPANFEILFDRILKGEFTCKIFHRLQLKVDEGKPLDVLNDILICHQSPAAMSRYYVQIGNHKEEQKSSGIWIATAAGSSGAIYSAGGRPLPDHSKLIQYLPRELYRRVREDLKFTGGILKNRQGLLVTSLMQQGRVFVDGCHVCLPFSFGITAKISHSPYPLQVVWT